MKDTTETIIRPPIVTIMGHVDHGKTSLLDYLRHSNVAAKEFGAITQHTDAYQVTVKSGTKTRKLTLIDTPGHAAFSEMRLRGGMIADIIVLVVASDDGVNKQTIEAIDVINKAEVPVIVAITKVDLEAANVEEVKKQLSRAGLALEGWGGQIPAVPISVKTGEGIQELLDLLFLTFDLNPPTNSNNEFDAVVIESHKDSRKGSTATIIVLGGKIQVGETVYTNKGSFKIKSIQDDWGQYRDLGLPGDPLEILGMKEILLAGSHLSAVSQPIESAKQNNQEINEECTQIYLYIKADTQGTLEAVVANVMSLSNEMCQLIISGSGVGDITENDVLLSSSSKSIILGFNVAAHSKIKEIAHQQKIIIKTYTLIYELLEDVEKLLQGITGQDQYEGKGLGIIVQLFTLTSGDIVAGLLITHGQLKEKDKIRILRENEEIGRDIVKQLRVGKERQKKVVSGNECGILLRKGLALQVEDVIEVI